MGKVRVVVVLLWVAALLFASPTAKPKCPQQCDTYADCVEVAGANFTCVCKAGLIGDGLPGRCHELKEVVKEHCRFQSFPLRYDDVLSKKENPADGTLCDDFKMLEAFLPGDAFEVDYLGDKLTSGDCATLLENDIICPDMKAVPPVDVSLSHNPLVKEGATIEAAIGEGFREIRHLVKLLDLQSLKNMALGHRELKYFKKDPLGCLFNIAEGIPLATRIWMTSEEVKRMGSFARSVVSNRFYSEPDLSNQGSYELYQDSAWDRGHVIPPQLASFDRRALQNSFSYAFTVPQAPKFNRVHWLEVEDALLKHLKSAFAGSSGEFGVFAGTSSKEIKVFDTPGGKTEFDLVEGPKRLLKGNITIPNSIWSQSIFVHVDPKTDEIDRVESITHMGNNNDDPARAIVLSVPLHVMEGVTGFKWQNITPHAKTFQTHLTKTLPFRGASS